MVNFAYKYISLNPVEALAKVIMSISASSLKLFPLVSWPLRLPMCSQKRVKAYCFEHRIRVKDVDTDFREMPVRLVLVATDRYTSSPSHIFYDKPPHPIMTNSPKVTQ